MRPTIRVEKKRWNAPAPDTRVFLVLDEQEFEIPVLALTRREKFGEWPAVTLEVLWPVHEVITGDGA